MRTMILKGIRGFTNSGQRAANSWNALGTLRPLPSLHSPLWHLRGPGALGVSESTLQPATETQEEGNKHESISYS